MKFRARCGKPLTAFLLALLAVPSALMTGCGSSGGGGGLFGGQQSTPALNGQAVNNPFGLDGTPFFVTLNSPGPAIRPRAITNGTDTISHTFGNIGGVPAGVTLNDVKVSITLSPRVTLTLPAGSAFTLPNSISLNSLSADNIVVTDVTNGTATGTPANLPSLTLAGTPITLTKQADGSYAPPAGTSLTINDTVTGTTLQQLVQILTAGPGNGISFSVNANVTPLPAGGTDFPTGTHFNIVFASSQLKADVTRNTGGGGGGVTPGTAGTFTAALSGFSTGANAYNGATTTPLAVGFNTSVTGNSMTGQGSAGTAPSRSVVVNISAAFTLTSGEDFSIGQGASVAYAEGTTMLWAATGGNVHIDSITGNVVHVTVSDVPGGTGGATMAPGTIQGQTNAATGTFVLKGSNT